MRPSPPSGRLVARRHMHLYGTTREDLARVAVHAHEMGSKNPNAHYRNKLTLAQVLDAGPVAEPLGVFDCAPLSDGAAAVVLGPLETARKHTDTPIRIAASQVACDTMALQHRADVTTVGVDRRRRAEQAFRQARRAPADVQVAEIHDAYTIAALVSLEDLGFVEKGRAGPEFATGRFEPEGERWSNTSGGLKAQGRPFGAVGRGSSGRARPAAARRSGGASGLRRDRGTGPRPRGHRRHGGRPPARAGELRRRRCRSHDSGAKRPDATTSADRSARTAGRSTFRRAPSAPSARTTARSIEKMIPFPLSGEGEVFSYTIVHDAAEGFELQVPYVLALVKTRRGPDPHRARSWTRAGVRRDRAEGPGHVPQAAGGREGRRDPLRVQVHSSRGPTVRDRSAGRAPGPDRRVRHGTGPRRDRPRNLRPGRGRPTRKRPRTRSTRGRYAAGYEEGIRSALREVVLHSSRGHTAQEIRMLAESRLARLSEEVDLKRKSLLAPPRRPRGAPCYGRRPAPPRGRGSRRFEGRHRPFAWPRARDVLVREERPLKAVELLRGNAASFPRVVIVSLHAPEVPGVPPPTGSSSRPERRPPPRGEPNALRLSELGGRLREPTEAPGGALVYIDSLEYFLNEEGAEHDGPLRALARRARRSRRARPWSCLSTPERST